MHRLFNYGFGFAVTVVLGIYQPATAATHMTCLPDYFTTITKAGTVKKPKNDIYVIIEEKTVTIGIVNQFDVFSDWVFDIDWKKGKRLTGQHGDGSLSFDGTMLQLAATQLVSGISVLRAVCRQDAAQN